MLLLFWKELLNGRNGFIPYSARQQNWEKVTEVTAEFMTTLCNN